MATTAGTVLNDILEPFGYARGRDGQIAYQVRGSGPGLVFLTGTNPGVGFVEEPLVAAYWERVAGFCRLVVHDPRGTGR